MKTAKNGALAVFAVLVVGLSAVCLSNSPRGGEKRYEIRPEITIPESKTDVARVLDAYEHLMDDYRQLMQSNLMVLQSELGNLNYRLDAIDAKISALSAQVETIQKKLGIDTATEKPTKAENVTRANEITEENPE